MKRNHHTRNGDDRRTCWPRQRWAGPVLALVLAGWACTLAWAAAPASDPAALDRAFVALATLEYGQDRKPLEPLGAALTAAHADPALQKSLEQRLSALLAGPATGAAKDYACRALSVIGTSASVPALAALLSDPALSSQARTALERIPGTAVDRALIAALPQLENRLKAGVINSLGLRLVPEAVPPLAGFLKDTDASVAGAAILALGQIATPEAVHALTQFRTAAPDALRATVDAASLEAAQKRLDQGDGKTAAVLFEALYREHTRGYLHQAGFQGLIAAQPDQAQQRLLDALRGDDLPVRQMAGRLVAELNVRPTPEVYRKLLATLAPEAQVVLIEAFRVRADPATRTSVFGQLNHADPAVRLAALQTLGVVGNAWDVSVLATRAAFASGPEKQMAQRSLAALRGTNINAAIVAMARDQATPKVQVELFRALPARSARETAPALVEWLMASDETVRQAAAAALGALGDEQQLPALIGRLPLTTTPDGREILEEAVSAIAIRVGEKALPSLLAGAIMGDIPTRAKLFAILANLGGPRAIEVVRTAAREAHPALQDAAVRALADWSEPGAAPDLLTLLKTTANAAHRALAFRGYIRFGLESEAPAAERGRILAEAYKHASSLDEKRLVLGALGEVYTVAALRLAAGGLADPELVDEAGATVVKIAAHLPPPPPAEIAEILQRVLQTVKAKPVADAARQQIERLGVPPR